MTRIFFAVVLLFSCSFGLTVCAQVHYYKNGMPWTQKADKGPDSVVPGWYYNLGISGIRVELVAEYPKYLLVKYVFKESPAYKKIRVGDYIIGAGNRKFMTDHINGYGEDKFGAVGPILDFAVALEASMENSKKGKLHLHILRNKKILKVQLKINTKYGKFSKSYPDKCNKTDLILTELYEYLAKNQSKDGSWGSPPHDTFAPLALLASGKKKYLPMVEKSVRMHARTTKAQDSSWLINWRYMAAGIVMSEYYLATKEKWVLKELQEVYEFLLTSQYISMLQIDEKTKKDRPEDLPKTPMNAHGGWGHNPGFEGYGPISMLSAQGALVFALMKECGIDIDRKRHEFAYEFLVRGTGANGYVWYADSPAGARNWADMGRTGATALANFFSPYKDKKYKKRAASHIKIIGNHPQSFPDTHGSPVMGMAYGAAASHLSKSAYRKLMDSNRYWFILSQCCDGSFYYQPNRDNAGYGADSRISASAVTAFILSLPKKSLHLSGK